MIDSPGRLLFVDDDRSLLDLFSRMLKGHLWDAHFCDCVDDALACLGQNSIDTVVVDIRMPGKDGFDLLTAIRSSKKTSQIPVIILTGDSDRGLKRKALDLGATDLLNKPVSREDLFARIRSSLRLKEFQDRLSSQVIDLDRRVHERTRQLEASQREVIWRLAKAAEYRDDETGNHVIRVALISRMLAEELGMDRDFVDLIFMTSPLHDIGKLAIPDSILLKDGRLSPQERKLMEQHCLMGAEILSLQPKAWAFSGLFSFDIFSVGEETRNPLLLMASAIALGHHEHWDGTGYPRGLKGKAISLESRIVAVADVFDALTSWRPYKPPLEEDEASRIVIESSGRHFDPDVVNAFIRKRQNLSEIRKQFREKEGFGTG